MPLTMVVMVMTTAVDQFDRWLRREFVEWNTELEEAYFAVGGGIPTGRPELDLRRESILFAGAKLVAQIAGEGRLPGDAGDQYHLLGAIGFYLAACRRHEVDVAGIGDAGTLRSAWSLASRLGSALGVAPRYVFAHQSTHGYRLFTDLDDERIFVTQNGLGVAAYQRAADALRRIPAPGVASPVAAYLLGQARAALDEVLRFNRELSATLDVDRFYRNVRPYYAPYRVGGAEYRGVNAGDFAAITEIDLRLGLCRADDPFYQRIVTEKYAYVPPEDQAALRAAVTAGSLLEEFLTQAETGGATARWRDNAELFLAVCRAHGAAYAFHHRRLVIPFLVEPARSTVGGEPVGGEPAGITASGPPLSVVVEGLSRLADLRAGRDRPGRVSARASLDRLRQLTEAYGTRRQPG